MPSGRSNTTPVWCGCPVPARLWVNFQKTFFNTISASVGGTDDPNILGLLDLEIWGAPTSKPAELQLELKPQP